MVFNTPIQLENYIMSQMKMAIMEAQAEIYEIIDNYLKQYYNEFDPSLYERTRQLLRSLVKSEIIQNNKGYKCRVYFDWENIDYSFKYINGKRYFNDTSAVGGTKGIVTMAMENETHGGYKAAQNTAIWKESMKILNRYKLDILRQSLIDNGIPIK